MGCVVALAKASGLRCRASSEFASKAGPWILFQANISRFRQGMLCCLLPLAPLGGMQHLGTPHLWLACLLGFATTLSMLTRPGSPAFPSKMPLGVPSCSSLFRAGFSRSLPFAGFPVSVSKELLYSPSHSLSQQISNTLPKLPRLGSIGFGLSSYLLPRELGALSHLWGGCLVITSCTEGTQGLE